MYKPLPRDEEYQKYQVALLSKGESLFLSQHDMELDNLSELYEPGYQTYTGYRINLIEANSLNYLVKQHNMQTSKVLRKYFKDRIQQYLSICAEELTVDQIKAYESGFYDGQKVA